MPSEKLTDITVQNAKTPAGCVQADIWDSVVSGLSVRVTSRGVKTFSFRFRDETGKTRRLKIGRYPDFSVKAARAEALELRVKVAKGENPAAQRRRAEVGNVASLIEEFLAKHAVHNRTAAETRRVLEIDFLPQFGDRDFTTIKRSEIIKLIDDIEHGKHKRPTMPGKKPRRNSPGAKPCTARNTLAAIRKMFNWAVSRDLLEVSPCTGVRCGTPAAKRDRVLDDAELTSVLRALRTAAARSTRGKSGWPFVPIVRLLILTAQRREQIAGLRWSWIDFDRREIVFPASIMKGKKKHILPMSDAIERELRALPRFDNGGALDDRVFPSRTKASEANVSGFSKAKSVLDEMSDVTGWRLHDLRRTARTGMSRLRVPRIVAETVLSHVIPGVEGVYDQHTYVDEMREALEAWARHVEMLVKAEEPKVPRAGATSQLEAMA